MSKKVAFFLFLLSLFAGFMLREMLYGVSNINNRKNQESAVVLTNMIKNPENPAMPIIEIVKLDVPKKAIKGTAFELVAYLKSNGHMHGDYDMTISLNKDNLKIDLDMSKNGKISTREWPEGGTVEVGPMLVFVPESVPSGEYVVALELFSKGEFGENLATVSRASADEVRNPAAIEIVNKYT